MRELWPDDDSSAVLQRCSENGVDPAMISFERNQAAGIENDSVHAAFRGLPPRIRCESTFLAHARSFGVSGPPVLFRTWFTMARNSAAFSSDF